jgi:DNA mismatch endonuclease (patch repair protein)
MSRIRRANTKPELAVRRLLHQMGYRYRIQFAKVPGRPDIAFPRRRKAIQVHGCFWHAHGCSLSRTPGTRKDFWAAKFSKNKERDARLERAAAAVGWQSLVIWECQVEDVLTLKDRLTAFLGKPNLSL